MKKLGLIGGISWSSTQDYYRYINEGINSALGGLNFAELLVYSVNFHDFQKNNVARNWEGTFNLLLNAAHSLKSAGAEGLVLCANTAHIVAQRIESSVKLPLIHIAHATADAIEAAGVRKVAFIGTQFTMEESFFKEILLARGISPVIPAKSADRHYIQETLRLELSKGMVHAETKIRYKEIIGDMLMESALEAVVLACTELPLILKGQDFAVPVFDTTRIHSEAAVKFALGQ